MGNSPKLDILKRLLQNFWTGLSQYVTFKAIEAGVETEQAAHQENKDEETGRFPPSPPQPTIISRATFFAAVLFILFVVVVILKELASFLRPFFIAIFLYYIGAPVSRFLRQFRIPKFLTNFIPIFLILIAMLIISFIVGIHVDEITEKIPAYKGRLEARLSTFGTWLSNHLPMGGAEFKAAVQGQTISLRNVEVLLKTMVGNFIGFVSASIMVTFFLIFIYYEADNLPRRLKATFGERQADRIMAIGNWINRDIIRYLYIKGVASLLVALLSILVMLFFQMDLVFLWGTLIFFGNFIPYIGSIVAVLFPIVMSLVQYDTVSTPIILAMALIACQIVVGNYLEPRYAGRQLNVSPLVVLLSLAFWGWVWGIVGLLLSVPIMVAIKIVLEKIPSTYKIALMLSHKLDDRRY